MPYGVYTYGNVDMGACSIQSALDLLEQKKQHIFNNIEKCDCIIGKGMG